MLAAVGFLIQLWVVSNKVESLGPQHRKYIEMQSKFQQLLDETAELEKSRKRIAGQVLSLNSSSALLQAISLVTPSGVQIYQLTQASDALIIKGNAVDPQAFARVNSLVLALSRCPLFDPASVQLVKAQRQQQESSSQSSSDQASAAPSSSNSTALASPSNPSQAPPLQKDARAISNADRSSVAMAPSIGSLSAPGSLSSAEFEVRAKFREASDQELSKIFIAYGSRGKALRINQLTKQGLMP